MTETRGLTSSTPIQTRPHNIVRRTRAIRHGPITRLMSPSDLGRDRTVSYLFEGSVRYEDSIRKAHEAIEWIGARVAPAVRDA